MQKKILIIQQKMIGDVLQSSILCENIKKYEKDSVIDFLVYDFAKPVLENNPFIDNIITYKKNNIFSIIKLVLKLKNRKYDYIIDCYTKIESALISLLTISKYKISYDKSYFRFIYTHNIQRISRSKRTHKFKIDPNLQVSLKDKLLLLSPIFNKNIELEITPKIYLTQEEIEKVKDKLASKNINNRKLIMINIFGSSENKTYPLDYMMSLVEYIIKMTNAFLIFNYTFSQREKVKDLVMQVNEKYRKNILLDTGGGDLRNLLSLIHHCNIVFGNEGGVINMAKALYKPTFAIFSPGVPVEGWLNKNDKENVGRELSDYKPKYFEDITWKERIKKSTFYYQDFLPSYLKEDILTFLKKNKVIEKNP